MEKWSKIESCIKLEKLCQPNFIQFLSHLEINIYNKNKKYINILYQNKMN